MALVGDNDGIMSLFDFFFFASTRKIGLNVNCMSLFIQLVCR